MGCFVLLITLKYHQKDLLIKQNYVYKAHLVLQEDENIVSNSKVCHIRSKEEHHLDGSS